MTFHRTCFGKNITISDDGTTASREFPTKASYTPFGQGVTFTKSPIDLASPFILEVLATDYAYSGTLCLGLTNHDPTSFKKLPTSSVPDFVQKPGNWGISVESRVEVGDWIVLKVNKNNSIRITLNDVTTKDYEPEGKIDFSKPVWGIIDVYGSVTKVGLLIPKANDLAAIEDVINGEDAISTVKELFRADETIRPLDIKLILLGEDADTVNLVKRGLLRDDASDAETPESNSLSSVTYYQDWIRRCRDDDERRAIVKKCADCVAKRLADRIEKSPPTETASKPPQEKTKAIVDPDLVNTILRRVKFNMLRTYSDVKGEISDGDQEKPCLSIWEFCQQYLDKSLHEMYIPSPVGCPMMILLVLNYDKLEINPECATKLSFLRNLHSTLQMLSTRMCKPTSDQNEPVHRQYLSPPVILVGIYDEMKSANIKIEEIETLIRGSLEEKVYQSHLMSLYHAIPHQDGSIASKGKKMIDDLRKHITRTAQGELDYSVETIPIHWYLLKRIVMKRKESGKLLLTPDEVGDVFAEIGMTDTDDCRNALHHLNETGIILTGANEKGVFICLEPDRITELVLKAMTVVDPTERWSTHNRMWSKLNKEGVLSETLLNHMWKDHMQLKELLIDFMKHHHLLYDVTTTSETSKEYMIPALLPRLLDSETSKPPSSNDVIMYIDFDGSMPDFIFLELCMAVRQWVIQNEGTSPVLAWDLCEYQVNDNTELTIVRTESDQSVIQIRIKNSATSGASQSTSHPLDHASVTMIKEQLIADLTALVQKTSQHKLHYTISVKCSSCDKLINLEDCLRKSVVTCQKGHKTHTSVFQQWFTAPSKEDANPGETKLLTDKILNEIASKLGSEWLSLGRSLGLKKEEIYQIQADHPLNVREQMFQMLSKWSDDCKLQNEREKVDVLISALSQESIDQGMLADDIKTKLNLE